MPTQQGDLSLLDDPVAQQLLNAPVPGHLGYVWKDGTPRVIPIPFTWTGKELVNATPSNSPKLLALEDGDEVAVTFDTYNPPFKVLYIRGKIHFSSYDGIVPEWQQAGERLSGREYAQGFENLVQAMLGAGAFTVVRLAVEPEWVGILDFETRFPSGVEKGMEVLQAASSN